MKNVRNINNYVVYFHRNPIDNTIFYVGIGELKRAYKIYKSSRNRYWNNFVKKLGIVPVIEIVHKEISAEEAAKLEMEYISIFGRKGIDKNGILLNRSTGGEISAIGFKHTEEARKKISEASKKLASSEQAKIRFKLISKNRKSTPESRLNISLSKRGSKNYGFGKHRSEETKRKIGIANSGKTGELSPVSRKVINTVTKEIYPSATHVSKISAINLGTLYGKLSGKRTNNTDFQFLDDYNSGKEKYINHDTSSKPIKIISLLSGEIYKSICEAARINNISDATIRFHLKGKVKKSLYSYL